MQIRLLVSAAAIALAATIGSASAADQFTTMEGIEGSIAAWWRRVTAASSGAVLTADAAFMSEQPVTA